MPWKKANKDLIKLLEETVPLYKCDMKAMFGSPTFFINGNMFAGVHEDTVILRLSEEDRKQIQSLHAEVKPFTPMQGHIMKEYMALPQSFCSKREIFRDWLKHSYQYATTLPPKKPKVSRKK